MGGYCAFYGEDDAEGKTLDDPRAYSRQSVWKRMFTVLMGPGMNFVLAFVVLMLYFWIGGAQVPVAAHPYVSQVESGPAQEAGLQAGDVITRIDGVDVLDGTTDTLINAIAAYDGDGPMLVTVQRGDTTFDTEITPFYDEAEGSTAWALPWAPPTTWSASAWASWPRCRTAGPTASTRAGLSSMP